MEFLINPAEFGAALNLLFATRSNPYSTDSLDLLAGRSTLTLQITGTSAEVTIEVIEGGGLRLPIETAKQMGHILKTYGQQQIKIHGNNGSVGVGKAIIKNRKIVTRETVRRKIDIPEDASSLDVLTLPELFTRVEIEESALTKRLRAEQEYLGECLNNATEALTSFGVTRQELHSLVQAHIRAHAPKVKQVLSAT